jgi:hypothetical protein
MAALTVVPSIMFCFGLVMALQGVVSNFAGLAATRFFLGICEAGAFPVSQFLFFEFEQRDVFIYCRCGTNELKLKNDSRSSSVRQLSRGRLVVFWPVPLVK